MPLVVLVAFYALYRMHQRPGPPAPRRPEHRPARRPPGAVAADKWRRRAGAASIAALFDPPPLPDGRQCPMPRARTKIPRPSRPPRTRTRSARVPKVGFVSLGCPKALVDSERILTQLRAEGYEVAPTLRGRGRRGGQHLRLHRRGGR